ncbi:hypothetical protein ACFCV3_41970 [Kribbella sp. NPDC056345]|uniref:hypothetical protein n=1 Tax=Kribbella sp. NPDC056345 TaxID=3345789 RepID=UPI0035DA1397
MKTAVSLLAAVALAAGLTACGPSGGYNVPFCVDDAMTLPAGKAPNPSRTSRPHKPYSKPSTTRTKTTKPYGYGGYHHDDDCD